MADTIKIKATMRFTPAKGYRLVERDMLVIHEDGSLGIVKAGTTLPLYDEELVTEVVDAETR